MRMVFISMVLWCAGLAAPALGTSFGDQFRSISMPPNGAGSFGLSGDGLADGRIVSITGRGLFVETAIGSGVMALAATLDSSILPAGSGADPAFLRVSPDGTRLAIGLGFGKPVAIVPVASLGSGSIGTSTPGVRLYNVPHTEAAWRNNDQLALSAGDFGAPSRITLLDTASSAAAPVNPTIISNIGGASAGVAFDSAGRLYTGNGFDLASGGGASLTGTIRAFSPAMWSSGPADFESGGTLIGKVLSASGLVFDRDGDLAVGGADFGAGDFGYLGLIGRSALGAVLAGGVPISSADAGVRHLAPDADPFAFYGAAVNPLTGELYATVTDFNAGGNTWYATIPAPCTGAALLALAMGRRRNR